MSRCWISFCCSILLSAVLVSGCNSQVKPNTAATNTARQSESHLEGVFQDGSLWHYTGGVLNGKPHGQGEMAATSGWRYKGSWQNSIRIEGTTYYPNGAVETGNFFNGKTTFKQAVNGLVMERTYRNGKIIKNESAFDMYFRTANYEKAFAMLGKRPFLGMQFQTNPKTGKLDVVRVTPNSPADISGIQPGDQILQYAGVVIQSNNDFLKLIKATAYGTSRPMQVARSGKILSFEVTPSIRPDNYVAGPGMVTMNSYQQLFATYLKDLSSFDERIAQLAMPQKYRSQAQRQKESLIASLKADQKCDLKEKLWVYQGDACKNGLAHGKGTAVNLEKTLKFEGEFRDGERIKGLIIANGIEMYDGPVRNGRPDGQGICFYEGEPEECKYYRGKRVDAVFKQRIALAKQRQFMEQQQAKQQAQIDSLRSDVKKAQMAAQQRQVLQPAASSNGAGDVLMDAAKRKAADKVMDAVFDKLF